MKKLKIITIVGARPQFIKAAAISRAIQKLYPEEIEEVIVHSGQHYDDNMSRVFFEEMSIPEPKYNLEVGSGTHGYQTAEIIRFTEKVLLEDEKPGHGPCLRRYEYYPWPGRWQHRKCISLWPILKRACVLSINRCRKRSTGL